MIHTHFRVVLYTGPYTVSNKKLIYCHELGGVLIKDYVVHKTEIIGSYLQVTVT